MHRAIAATAAFVLAGSVVASAPAVAEKQPTAVDKGVNTDTLRKDVTVNGILQHQRQFQVIANRNGGNRAAGLPGYDQSATYVARTLRDAGYRVRQQAFTFPFFRELTPSVAQQTAPEQADLENQVFTYSGGGDVSGEIVPIDVQIPPPAEPGSTSGCEADDFPPAPSPTAIALIQRGSCTFFDKATNAADAGYGAVMIFNEGQEGRTDIVSGTLGEQVDLPVVGLSYADGASLVEQAGEGTVEAQVITDVEFDPNRETVNVFADSRIPTKNDDQVVVVGGHLDSVGEGPGINDNGSATAAMLEIAEQMAQPRYVRKLQRPVRFAFWGAEELGLLGSEHYVENLSNAQRARIYANLNFDMIGSPNYVRFVYDGDGSDTEPAGPVGSGQIETIFTDYFDSQGLEWEPTEFSGRSDYGPFIAVGIPAGGLFTGAEGIKTEEQAEIYGGEAGVAYDECYHEACDDISNLSTSALQEMGDAAAHATAVMTMSKKGLFGDQLKRNRGKSAAASMKAPHDVALR